MIQGQVCLVDDDFYEHASKYKWRLIHGYATRHTTKDGIQYDFKMHREIMNPPKHLDIDHIDGNRLNNQRSNLRVVTRQQNLWNNRVRSDSRTGFKGVSYHPTKRRKYRTIITLNGKRIPLGYYMTPEEAHRAYCMKAKELFGDFANSGIPTEVDE